MTRTLCGVTPATRPGPFVPPGPFYIFSTQAPRPMLLKDGKDGIYIYIRGGAVILSHDFFNENRENHKICQIAARRSG